MPTLRELAEQSGRTPTLRDLAAAPKRTLRDLAAAQPGAEVGTVEGLIADLQQASPAERGLVQPADQAAALTRYESAVNTQADAYRESVKQAALLAAKVQRGEGLSPLERSAIESLRADPRIASFYGLSRPGRAQLAVTIGRPPPTGGPAAVELPTPEELIANPRLRGATTLEELAAIRAGGDLLPRPPSGPQFEQVPAAHLAQAAGRVVGNPFTPVGAAIAAAQMPQRMVFTALNEAAKQAAGAESTAGAFGKGALAAAAGLGKGVSPWHGVTDANEVKLTMGDFRSPEEYERWASDHPGAAAALDVISDTSNWFLDPVWLIGAGRKVGVEATRAAVARAAAKTGVPGDAVVADMVTTLAQQAYQKRHLVGAEREAGASALLEARRAMESGLVTGGMAADEARAKAIEFTRALAEEWGGAARSFPNVGRSGLTLSAPGFQTQEVVSLADLRRAREYLSGAPGKAPVAPFSPILTAPPRVATAVAAPVRPLAAVGRGARELAGELFDPYHGKEPGLERIREAVARSEQAALETDRRAVAKAMYEVRPGIGGGATKAEKLTVRDVIEDPSIHNPPPPSAPAAAPPPVRPAPPPAPFVPYRPAQRLASSAPPPATEQAVRVGRAEAERAEEEALGETRRALDELEGVPAEPVGPQFERQVQEAARQYASTRGPSEGIIASRLKGRVLPEFERVQVADPKTGKTRTVWRNKWREHLPESMFVKRANGQPFANPEQLAAELGIAVEGQGRLSGVRTGGAPTREGRRLLRAEDLRAYAGTVARDTDYLDLLHERWKALRDRHRDPRRAAIAFYSEQRSPQPTREELERARREVLDEHYGAVEAMREGGELPPARARQEDEDILGALVARRARERRAATKYEPVTSAEIERQIGRTSTEGLHGELNRAQAERAALESWDRLGPEAQDEIGAALKERGTVIPPTAAARAARLAEMDSEQLGLRMRRHEFNERLADAMEREEREALEFDPADLDAVAPVERRLPAIPPGSELERKLDRVLETRAGRDALERRLVREPFTEIEQGRRGAANRIIARMADADAAAVRQEIDQYVARARGGTAPPPTPTGQTGFALPPGPPRPPAGTGAPQTGGLPPPPTGQPFRLPERLQRLREAIVADHRRMAEEELHAGVLRGTRENYLYHMKRFEDDRLVSGLRRGRRRFPFLKKREDPRTIARIEGAGEDIEGDLVKIWLERRTAHTRLMHRVELVRRFKRYLNVEFDYTPVRRTAPTGERLLSLEINNLRYRGSGAPPPPEIREQIVNTLETFLNPEKTSAMGKLLDSANGIVKPWMTSMRAGYSALNFATNKWNRWISGAADPVNDLIAGLGLLVDMKLPVSVTEAATTRAISERLGRMVVRSQSGARASLRELKQAAEAREIFSHGIFAAEQRPDFTDLAHPLKRSGLLSGKPQDWGHRMAGALAGGAVGGPAGAVAGAAAGPAAVRVGRVLAGSIEDIDRFAVFLDGWRKGLSFDQAADRVRKILFDYKAGSRVEREYFGRFFLFYKWFRENIPYQVKSLAVRPASFGVLGKLQRQITETTAPTGGPPDERFMEPWQKALVLARTGARSEQGSPLYLNMRFHPGADLNGWGLAEFSMGGDFLALLRNAVAQASPVFRVPLEEATRRLLFTDQEIQEGVAGEWVPARGDNVIAFARAMAKIDPDWGPDTGAPDPLDPEREVTYVRRWQQRLVEQLGALAEYDRAFPQQRKEGGPQKVGDIPLGEWLLPVNLLRGSQNAAYEQARETRGRERLLQRKGTAPRAP